MFPRRKRLKRSEFPAALKVGRRVSSQHFTVVLPKNTTGYAVIVSKKTARLSVTRHRIKRRVSEVLRTLALSGKVFPPSVILYPRASVMDMEYDSLRRELMKLLS
ncbi:ribonuclease P protein component [Candidatus Kaiserbacteria bacterium]|nr:ribonuclease P protein component [Candidatus Kaiserbacteria bacterium]